MFRGYEGWEYTEALFQLRASDPDITLKVFAANLGIAYQVVWEGLNRPERVRGAILEQLWRCEKLREMLRNLYGERVGGPYRPMLKQVHKVRAIELGVTPTQVWEAGIAYLRKKRGNQWTTN